jgi:hypothetical protein
MTSPELSTIDEINALEQLYVDQKGPLLGPAHEALAARWDGGQRDRETLLRLAFLEWYSCSEPGFLTGPA